MTALPAQQTLGAAALTPAHRRVHTAVAIGLVAVILETVLLAFAKTTDSGDYKYAADYWLNGSVLPHALAGILLLPAVRALQGARDGRLGLAGIVLNTVALTAVAVECAASVAVGHDALGAVYVLSALGTLLGTAMFAAASWRAGLLPRWLLAVWPIVWIIGSFFAVSVSPLLLGVFYIVLVAVLRRPPASEQ